MQIPDLIVDTAAPAAHAGAAGGPERNDGPGKPDGDHDTEEFASALETLLLATAGAQLVTPPGTLPGQASAAPGDAGETPVVDAAVTLMAALRGVIETAAGIRDTESEMTPSDAVASTVSTEAPGETAGAEIAPVPEAPLPADLPAPAEPAGTAEASDAVVTDLQAPAPASDAESTGDGQTGDGERTHGQATPATPPVRAQANEHRIDGLERAARTHEAAPGTPETGGATAQVVDHQPVTGPAGSTAASPAGAPRADGVTTPTRVERLAPTFVQAVETAQTHPSGTHRLTVRLDPPELGAISLQIVARGDDVRIVLRADTPEARAALEGQRATIEQALAGEGFDLSSFDVHGEGQRRWGQSRRTRDDADTTDVAAFDEAVDADDEAIRL